MKKLMLLAFFCIALSCKKKTEDVVNITAYTWSLTSATSNPGRLVNGKSETNLLNINDGGCINKYYTLSFSTNGTYAYSSSGPLCDMFISDKARWTKNGNEITLINGYAISEIVTLSGNTITSNHTYESNGINYTVTYVFTAKKK